MDANRPLEEYTTEWTRQMLKIWQEKIVRMKIVRSGRLHESFHSKVERTSTGQTIHMMFAQYGVYQALGVGYSFKKFYTNRIPGTNKAFKIHSLGLRPNFGDLPFMERDYRADHGLDEPKRVGPAWGGYLTSGQMRVRRDWFSKKLYMSVMNMVEDMARILGETAGTIICEAMEDVGKAAQ